MRSRYSSGCKGRTANLGLRNSLSSCRLLKCMSSGSSHSSFRRLADAAAPVSSSASDPRRVPVFLDPRFEAALGIVSEALGAGAKSVLLDGPATAVEKSIVNGALGAFAVRVAAGAAASGRYQQSTQRAAPCALPFRVTFLSRQCS